MRRFQLLLLTAALAAAVAVVTGCGESSTAESAGGTGASSSSDPRTSSSTPDPRAEEAGFTGPAKVAESDYKITKSGLKYAILQEGSGPAATAEQNVKVHYTGWLQDGTKFDSSRDRGEPIEFPLGHGAVIKGWDEGVQGMKVGEKRQLVIPPDIAYGAEGRSGIPPNSTLVFDVELVELGAKHNH
jgi:FKBP-type peptidyl-prolyl cis-trans isomerase